MTMDAATSEAPAPAWRPLPVRAASLFMLGHAALVALPLGFAATMAAAAFEAGGVFAAGAVGLASGLAAGAWYGYRSYRSTAWLLDADGFALRRGRLWQRETRVPASRVQHLDLRHGPLERRWRLATLVIHTAGSRFSTVSVSGLDAGDAERLRDRLARQVDDDDDA
jgi:membrane protein YdbS with pleckstrin-like domain